MKVKELIEKLKGMDGDLPVLVSGYEGGIREKDVDCRIVKYRANVNTEWYYGEHEPDKDGQNEGVEIS